MKRSSIRIILCLVLVLLLCLPALVSCGSAEVKETQTPEEQNSSAETAEKPTEAPTETRADTHTETRVVTETPTEEPSPDTASHSEPSPDEDINEGLSFKIENGKATVWCSKKNIKDVVIPASIAGYPVVEVAAKGFKGMAKIRSLVLPEGLLKIGESAFEGCSSLASVVLPESLIELGERAFYGCSELENFTIGHNLKNCRRTASRSGN